MIPYLVQLFLSQLESMGLGFLRVFTFPVFQSIASAGLALVLVLFLGPSFIRWLSRKKIGDRPNFDQADINKMMAAKVGVPTMGGLLIVSAIATSALLLADVSEWATCVVIASLIAFALIGMIDDWQKLTRAKESRQGLSAKKKLIYQFVAAIIVVGTWLFATSGEPASSTIFFPFFKPESGVWIAAGTIATSIVAVLAIVGTSNAVNLTDGLDGLASGLTVLSAFALMTFALIIGDVELSSTLLFHHVPSASQAAVIGAAVGGACLGFLWFNCPPASVFMGDTGSLALGATLGAIAVVIRQEFILLILGAVFVAEALSVMLQVAYFKYSRRRTGIGKRIFLMSPLHHHFQKKHWTETQVVIRFWLIGVVLTLIALSSIKLR